MEQETQGAHRLVRRRPRALPVDDQMVQVLFDLGNRQRIGGAVVMAGDGRHGVDVGLLRTRCQTAYGHVGLHLLA